MFKIQGKQVNAAGTKREWKDLRFAPRFTSQEAAEKHIQVVFLDDPQSTFDASDFRVKPV